MANILTPITRFLHAILEPVAYFTPGRHLPATELAEEDDLFARAFGKDLETQRLHLDRSISGTSSSIKTKTPQSSDSVDSGTYQQAPRAIGPLPAAAVALHPLVDDSQIPERQHVYDDAQMCEWYESAGAVSFTPLPCQKSPLQEAQTAHGFNNDSYNHDLDQKYLLLDYNHPSLPPQLQSPQNHPTDHLLPPNPSTHTQLPPLSPSPLKPRAPKRGRKRKPRTTQELVTRRTQFLTRNRIAAERCRKKKKVWTHDLEAALRGKEEISGRLKAELAGLVAEAERLRAMVGRGCRGCILDKGGNGEGT